MIDCPARLLVCTVVHPVNGPMAKLLFIRVFGLLISIGGDGGTGIEKSSSELRIRCGMVEYVATFPARFLPTAGRTLI